MGIRSSNHTIQPVIGGCSSLYVPGSSPDHLHSSTSNLHLGNHILLDGKPRTPDLPLLGRVCQLNLESMQERRTNLVQLEHGEVPAGADARTITKGQIRRVPFLHANMECLIIFARLLQPTLRAEGIRVLAKDALVAANNPRVKANSGTGRNKRAIRERDAAGGDVALKKHGSSRVDTESFANASFKIGELASTGIGDRLGAVKTSGLDLLGHSVVDGTILEHVVEDSAEGDGSSVGTREQVNKHITDDLVVINEVRMSLLGVDEMLEVIRVFGVIVLVLALQTSNEGLDGDTSRVDQVGGSDTLDGVLVKEVVKDGNLTDRLEVAKGGLGFLNGPIEVTAVLHVAEATAEGHGADEVPSVWS